MKNLRLKLKKNLGNKLNSLILKICHLTNEKNTDVYIYAYKTFIEFISILIISLLIAGINDTIPSNFMFLLTYFFLRKFGGGWHSKSRVVCYIVTILVIAIQNLMPPFKVILKNDVTYILFLTSIIVVIVDAFIRNKDIYYIIFDKVLFIVVSTLIFVVGYIFNRYGLFNLVKGIHYSYIFFIVMYIYGIFFWKYYIRWFIYNHRLLIKVPVRILKKLTGTFL